MRRFRSVRVLARQVTIFAFSVGFAACGNTPRAASGVTALPSSAAIDSAARVLMQRAEVQGLAIAVIDGGSVRHVGAYGMRNVAKGLPLTPRTVMYGASLTKTAVAYLVLQLVDEGRIALDRSIADYLPKPLPEYPDYQDLANDPRWKQLTLRILLNHASGFANFRWLEEDRVLRFHFDPGARYAYSGEGFYIVQLVLEEALGLELGAEMERRLFAPHGLTRTSMQWRADFAEDLADGYAEDGSVEPHDERSRPSAAGSMDTSIEDQARLWAAIVRGDGLSDSSRAELIRAQLPIRSKHQFPTLREDRGGHDEMLGLSAGLGLVTYRDVDGPVWFKGGHNDWTGNMVVCRERQRRCVVLLANDVRAERIYPELVRLVLGDLLLPWSWEYSWYTP